MAMAADLLKKMAEDLEDACEDVEAVSIAGGLAMEAVRGGGAAIEGIVAETSADVRGGSLEGVCVTSFLGNFATYVASCGEVLEEGEEEALLVIAHAAHPREFVIQTAYAGDGEEKAELVIVEGDGISAEEAREALSIIVTRRIARARDQLRRAKRYYMAREKFWEHKLVWKDARVEYGRVRRRMKRARRAYTRARKSVRVEWR